MSEISEASTFNALEIHSVQLRVRRSTTLSSSILSHGLALNVVNKKYLHILIRVIFIPGRNYIFIICKLL